MKLYLYFNDLSWRARCSKQSPRSVPKKVKEQPIAPSQRVRGNNRGQAPHSRDASVAEGSFLKRSVDAPAASTVRRDSSTQSHPAAVFRAITQRYASSAFAAFLVATAALNVGVTSDYRNYLDSLR